jgi:hypothetical protein
MSLKGYPMLGNPALGNIKFIKIRFLFCNIFHRIPFDKELFWITCNID